MRNSCLECVAKHLGSAAIYIEEVSMGYPNYFGYAYGELNHAASECYDKYPDLAWAIREHRIKWGETRSSQKPHKIPFEALFDYITVLETLEDSNSSIEVPDEVYEGLSRNDDGTISFSLDTRPRNK